MPMFSRSTLASDRRWSASDSWWTAWRVWLFAVVLLGVAAQETRALVNVVLRDGTEIVGEAQVEGALLAVASGPRVLRFGRKQVARIDPVDGIEPPVRRRLNQPSRPRGNVPDALGQPTGATPFDAFGRRTVSFPATGDIVHAVDQGIVEIYPTHVVVKALGAPWRSTVDLDDVPSPTLLAILERTLDHESPRQPLRNAMLLSQAGRFQEAADLLKRLDHDPNVSTEQRNSVRASVDRELRRQLLRGLREAASIGQPARARALLDASRSLSFDPAERAERDELARAITDTDSLLSRGQRLLEKLSENAAPVMEREMVAIALREIEALLTTSTADRLTPLVQLGEQEGTEPKPRLALALSGWALGSRLAHPDLDRALITWKQRRAVAQSLNGADEIVDGAARTLASLNASASTVSELIAHLPWPDASLPTNSVSRVEDAPRNKRTPAETRQPPSNGLQPPRLETLKLSEGEAAALISLPPEYDRSRPYPCLVLLAGADAPPEFLLKGWEPAARAGFIVCCPNWRVDPRAPYTFSDREHARVLEIIASCRRRWAVDSDRLFLAGHELGGVATWDIGAGHPDQFAGLISIAGPAQFYARHYDVNLVPLPIYAVEGSRHGDNAKETLDLMQRLIAKGSSAVFAEYPGRGRDLFRGEINSLVAWMRRQRRPSLPADVRAVAGRTGERRFHWLAIDRFAPGFTVSPELFGKSRFRPARLTGHVTDSNAIEVTSGGIEALSLYLGPGPASLEDPSLSISVNRKKVHQGPLALDLALMLREARRTGDRRRLVSARVTVDRP